MPGLRNVLSLLLGDSRGLLEHRTSNLLEPTVVGMVFALPGINIEA